jgi:3-hydroxyacyl-[acyl-carrier-protein] dehydratase
MRFVLIDRIRELQPGRSLVAIKNLSLSEEYLADHFPGFPVMPGVLMLEALTQAGAWLLRDHEDFAHSVIVLKEAKTIKYGSFVEPGRRLELHVELIDLNEKDARFKGKGICDDQVMVSGRFTLTRYNLRDRNPLMHATDASIVTHLRDLYATLRKGSVGAKAISRNGEGVDYRLLATGQPAGSSGSDHS